VSFGVIGLCLAVSLGIKIPSPSKIPPSYLDQSTGEAHHVFADSSPATTSHYLLVDAQIAAEVLRGHQGMTVLSCLTNPDRQTQKSDLRALANT
jgi:hypothetical protein